MYVPCPEFREDEGCYDLVKKMAREAVKTFKDDRVCDLTIFSPFDLVPTAELFC